MFLMQFSMSTLIGRALRALGIRRAARMGSRSVSAGQQRALWRAALREMLSHHPEARRVLPSLAVLERALTRGPRALERLPAKCLRDASARLDDLVGDWGSEGITQLRDHLRALSRQASAAEVATRPPPELHAEIEVSEVSMAFFLQADELLERQVEQVRKMPEGKGPGGFAPQPS